MKKILYFLLLFLSFTSYSATQRIELMGMVCAFCAQGIEKNLQDIEGVSNVYINLVAEEVRFELTVGANPRRFSRPVH